MIFQVKNIRVLMNCRYFLFIFFITSIHSSYAQVWKSILPGGKEEREKETLKKQEQDLQNKLRGYLSTLTDNQMEGRKVGTIGEQRAGMYIEKVMSDLKLQPYIGRSFRQHFKYESGKMLTPETKFFIDNKLVNITHEAFPLSFSAATQDEAFAFVDSKEPNAPWIISLYNSEEEARNKDIDWEALAYQKATLAAKMEASSVIFYDAYGASDQPEYTLGQRFEPLAIPVVFVKHDAYKKIIQPIKTITSILISIKFRSELSNATNIVGWINNQANKNIVIGAHYDYLGRLKSQNQFYSGADDNASGVAMMLALAEKLKQEASKNYNYIFVAYSASEASHSGVKSFLNYKHDLPIAFAINLDMVGRLPHRKNLIIDGIGTGNTFKDVFEKIKLGNVHINETYESIASDHQIFWSHKIPAIGFSTGLHDDYRKPTDMVGKINFPGMREVYGIVEQFIQQVALRTSIAYQNDLAPVQIKPVRFSGASAEKVSAAVNPSLRSKTASRITPNRRVNQITKTPQEVGIIADEKYEGNGVLIGNVTPGSAAEKAGLQQGDILVKVENTTLFSLDDFNKLKITSNNCYVKVKRGAAMYDYTMKL